MQLTETVTPSDLASSYKGVTWTSSDTSIATVDTNGLVTASWANEGTATIIATSTTDTSKSASCTITVPNVLTYTWSELSALAKEISNDSSIESSTARFFVKLVDN